MYGVYFYTQKYVLNIANISFKMIAALTISSKFLNEKECNRRFHIQFK